MGKAKIGAREAVNDINSGMTDAELMKKYSLTSKGLDSLFVKLVEVNLLDESFVRNRMASTATDVGAKPSQPPASAPQAATESPAEPSDLALAVLQDLKDGQHDAELMRRYELSPGKLNEIRAGLVQSGLLAGADTGQEAIKPRLCPFCSQEIKPSAVKCPHCDSWLEPGSPGDPTRAAAPTASPAGVESDEEPFEDDKECPWEERESYGTLNAYFQTATKCILTPTSFFSKLPVRDGYLNPILFAAMSIPIPIVLTYLWIGLFTGFRLRGLVFVIFGMSLAFVAGLIFLPIFLSVWSGVLHLCLYLVGGVREGYQATFRVVSYSSVTSILSVVPFVGSIAGWLWGLVLHVIGLRETHETTTGKAVAAVAIPFVILVVFGLIVGIAGATKLLKFRQAVPVPACMAVDNYIARVDGVAGLDAKEVDAEVKAAVNELMNDLKPFKDQPRVILLQQKALVFGIAVAQQAKSGTQVSGGIDILREELLKACRK